MSQDLLVPVGDLIGSPGKTRSFAGEVAVRLRLGETTVNGPLRIVGAVHGLLDAVRAEFESVADVHMTCTRCLTEWDEKLSVAGRQYFGLAADEDGYAISGGQIDIAPPARDEFALALPGAPLCRPDCLGLCPTCGTDLNSEPCDGHWDDADSPFAVLKDLFDS